MRVPPHPHTSLQTVSWTFGGEILHRDSVGSEASFPHFDDLPVVELDEALATVLIGELDGAASPATAYSPLVGADLQLGSRRTGQVSLRLKWEWSTPHSTTSN